MSQFTDEELLGFEFRMIAVRDGGTPSVKSYKVESFRESHGVAHCVCAIQCAPVGYSKRFLLPRAVVEIAKDEARLTIMM